MELQDILELMDKFEASSMVSFDFAMGDVKLNLKKPDGVKRGGHAHHCPPPQPMPMQFPMPMQMAMPVSQPAQGFPPPAPAEPSEPAEAPAPEAEYIKSPLVGTFYAASSPESEPFVAVGQRVNKGGVVCLVEAMKMMNDVTAPFDCVIEEVVAQNGEPIGFDDPMFRVSRV